MLVGGRGPKKVPSQFPSFERLPLRNGEMKKAGPAILLLLEGSIGTMEPLATPETAWFRRSNGGQSTSGDSWALGKSYPASLQLIWLGAFEVWASFTLTH